MKWHQYLRFAAAFLLLAATSLGDETLGQRDGAPGNAVLVLQSGDVLEGKVSRQDDRYLVVLPAGRIYVPESNVDLVCATLQDAYRARRSRIGVGQAQEHARLAQWCQRHGLIEAAREQLTLARQIEPNHPLVGLVERRLTAPELSELAQRKSREEQAQPLPTIEQLEDFVAGLPPATVESFTRTVQPILLNRCATAGCHTDRADNDFRLERPRPGGPLVRTSTLRNLLATIKLIDSSAPARSELLNPQKCPHRLNTDAGVALARSGQHNVLAAWVRGVTRQSATQVSWQPSTASTGAADAPARRPDTIRSGPPSRDAWSEPVAKASSPQATGSPEQCPTGIREAEEIATRPAPAAPAPSAGVDPFDPKIFNRRYGTSPPQRPEAKKGKPVPAPSPFFTD